MIRNRLALARQLSVVDWIILSLAWWMLLWYYLYLRWGGFDYPASSAGASSFEQRLLDSALRLHRLVELASRLHPFPVTCLPRALVLGRLLAWRGIPSELRIGVARHLSGIQAHAWVVVAGIPVGEVEDVAEKFHILEHIASRSNYTFSP